MNEDIFKTVKIIFRDREDFNTVLDMNNLADDIGHSDMILSYSNKFFRDRFAGILATQGIDSFLIED